VREKSLCALPWYNLNTTPLGQCKLCCNISDFKVIYQSTDKTITGRKKRAMGWGRDSVADVWNSRHMQEVRSRMLAGEAVEDCGECLALEAKGAESPRQAANAQYPEVFEDENLQPTAHELPRSLELRLSTRCNLRCHTCWSGSSDRIATERTAVLRDPSSMPAWLQEEWRNDIGINLLNEQDFDSDGDYINQQASMDNFAACAAKLKRLYITGGEPTMDANVYRYLDTLVAHNNLDCHVSFTTNATLWNPKLMERLGHFQRNEIQISVDGHEQVNDFVRYPSVWAVVHENVERYFMDRRVQEIKVFTVISALNLAAVPRLLRWLIDTANRLQRAVVWWPIMLNFPKHLRVESLPAAHTQWAQQQLEQLLDDHHAWNEYHCDWRNGLQQVIKVLHSTAHTSVAEPRLREYLDFMDKIRHTRWRAQLPHLADL
jgi:MoaA/NifB/PqqE/SkfB family radical SAM enzyme